ncbi:MAG: exosortase/archaeosortase family protein [Candidatus Bathyarchaeota archaeon]|nr:MAG: exosortase/archaeosortase family protein [Candidatus Bathyarchaeota archaeon]
MKTGINMKNPHLPLHMPSRSSLVLGLRFSIIVVAALTVLYQDLVILANDALQSEFMSHILAIPFLFGYLIYRKRKMIRASVPSEPSPRLMKAFLNKEIIGALLFLTAFFIYSFGSYTFTPLGFHMFTLPIFVAACTLIMFNTKTLRQLAFPILFLFFLVPPPIEIVYTLGSTLSVVSTLATVAILNLFGFAAEITTVYANPIITITQPNGTPLSFTVDVACSGIYSLIGFLIFATFIAYIARTKMWKKPSILLIGLPMIYLLNIIRITIIVLLGYYYGMELAMNVFHLLGGWTLIFLGTLLLLVITEKTLKIQLFTKHTTVSCPDCNPVAEREQDFCSSCGRLLQYAKLKLEKMDLAKIAAISTIILLIVSIQAPVFVLTKGPADILTQLAAGQEPTTDMFPQIDGYELRFVDRDEDFEKVARQDASLTYAYVPANQSRNVVWVTLEIASANGKLHPWEKCLITYPLGLGQQAAIWQLDLRDVQLIENPPIIARYFAFHYKMVDLTQVVLYWYETSTFVTNFTSLQRHVKISLIVFPGQTESAQEAEVELLPFGIAVANHWQPLKTWVPIALLISQNGYTLTAFPTAALILALVFYTLTQRKEKKTNTKAYNKLTKQDRKIMRAVKKTQRETIPTFGNIAATYKELNREAIDAETLLSKLEQARSIDLIKQEIASHQDEPTMTWKIQM